MLSYLYYCFHIFHKFRYQPIVMLMNFIYNGTVEGCTDDLMLLTKYAKELNVQGLFNVGCNKGKPLIELLVTNSKANSQLEQLEEMGIQLPSDSGEVSFGMGVDEEEDDDAPRGADASSCTKTLVADEEEDDDTIFGTAFEEEEEEDDAAPLLPFTAVAVLVALVLSSACSFCSADAEPGVASPFVPGVTPGTSGSATAGGIASLHASLARWASVPVWISLSGARSGSRMSRFTRS